VLRGRVGRRAAHQRYLLSWLTSLAAPHSPSPPTRYKYYSSIAGVSEENTHQPVINERSKELVEQAELASRLTSDVNRDYSTSDVSEAMLAELEAQSHVPPPPPPPPSADPVPKYEARAKPF
jgi:hypothetical protein